MGRERGGEGGWQTNNSYKRSIAILKLASTCYLIYLHRIFYGEFLLKLKFLEDNFGKKAEKHL